MRGLVKNMIGKKPIFLPKGVRVEIKDRKIIVEGPKGKIEKEFPEEISFEKTDDTLKVNFKGPKEKKALWGTWRAHVKNMVEGAVHGFEKKLRLEGIGYEARVSGKNLILKVGFTHDVNFPLPQGIEAKVEKNIITIFGIDKELVGQVAANIRKISPPDPYKGKGIRYVDEVLKLKISKKAKGAK